MSGNYHRHLAIAIVFCPLWGWAQDEVEPIAVHLERYMFGGDQSVQREVVKELIQRAEELMPEIERRLAALESGTDRYSSASQDRHPRGGALYYLGHLANTLGDEGFAHAYWKRATRKAIGGDLHWWMKVVIIDQFIQVATQDDLPMLIEIAESKLKLPPETLRDVKEKIDHLSKNGTAQSTANNQRTTRVPPILLEIPTRAFEAPEAEEKPNTLLYVVLGFLVVAVVAFVAELKTRKQ